MPLSTSNSDDSCTEIPYREIPEQNWTSIFVITLVSTIISITAWEILARYKDHIPGTYQSGHKEMWAEERRKLDNPNHDYRIVLTGSSRILWASDLDIMEKGFGTRPLQLALPGTSPALFVEDIVDNTDFDGLILVGVTPFLVNKINLGFFGGPAMEYYKNASPADISGYYLHNFLSNYLGFMDSAFSIPELKNHYIELPHREGSIVLNQKGWKLGDVYSDRQTDMWPPIENKNSFDNQQMLNFWLRGGGLEKRFSEEEQHNMNNSLLEFFTPLVLKQREKGGDVLFIRMPSSGDYRKQELRNDYTERFWLPVVQKLDIPFIDCFDYPELSTKLEIPEWSHFSRQSQDIWSKNIVKHIERVYLNVRGEPLTSITHQ